MNWELGLTICGSMMLGGLLVASGFHGLRRRTHIDGRMRALVDMANATPEVERQSRMALFAIGRGCVGRQGPRQRIARQLVAAGVFDPRALALFGYVRVAAALVGSAAAGFVAAKLSVSSLAVPAALLIGFCLGFYLPAWLLDAHAVRQTKQRKIELPIVISLILMTLESGSTVDQALRFASQAAERAHMRMARPMRRLISEIGKGAPYESALARFGDRIDISEGRDFASLLAQSIVAGTQIGEALQMLITDLLEKRVAMARETIGRCAVLVSVVLILCFLPVLFILIGAPMAASLSHSMSQVVTK